MEELLKTCLCADHQALGAQMNEFAGYLMPIQYSDITAEHNAVRKAVGMFDVSHMGEIFVSGPDAESFVSHIFTNDIIGIAPGKVLYGMMLHPCGGVVDDLLVYKSVNPSLYDYLLVVNASNIAKDYAWLLECAQGYDVKVINASDEYGQIAVQGPLAEKTVVEVLAMEAAPALEFYTYCETLYQGKRVILSRTGYTGEDGFEIYADTQTIVSIWRTLIEAGVTPCGLGCRDTLRFEAGLPLYGHELSDEITPLEAGLGMFVKLNKPEFVGKDALAKQKEEGVSRKLVGIELLDRAIPRGGYSVETADGTVIGTVTTGYRSISLDRSVCVAMVPKEYSALETELFVRIRKKVFPGKVCKKRFYQTNYKK